MLLAKHGAGDVHETIQPRFHTKIPQLLGQARSIHDRASQKSHYGLRARSWHIGQWDGNTDSAPQQVQYGGSFYLVRCFYK